MEVAKLDLFNSNVRNIELNSIIEKNNFNLVRDYFEGAIVEKEFGISAITIDNDFIMENIKEIGKKINTANYTTEIQKALDKKLSILSELYGEFKIYDRLSKKIKFDKVERKLFDENKSKLFYLILELRISTGLTTEEINHNDIMDYCSILACDVNNGKYKRLDFQSHIDDDGKVNRFK